MKIFLVAFAELDKLKERTDTEPPVDGMCVRNGDCVGYLFEDRTPTLPAPPQELAGEVVLLWQHRSSTFRDAQRQWLDKSKVLPQPLFSHVGTPRLQLRSVFVEKSEGTLKEVVSEFYGYGAVDLLEQTLAWNALMQFFPERQDREKAEEARDELAGDLKYHGVMEYNLQAEGLSPSEWEVRLRAKVAERSAQLGS